MKEVKIPPAMAFFHPDGLVPAWKLAASYAGKEGRIATLPDIVDARLGTNPSGVPWEIYFTTLSAEYFGKTRGGAPIIIVAHGIGPMATLDRILQVYSHEFKSQNRSQSGGRISQIDFDDLANGEWGEVEIIDFRKYCKKYKYPFIQILRSTEALEDPLLRARLGPKTETFVRNYTEYVSRWHSKQAILVPEEKYGLKNSEEFLARRKQKHLSRVKYTGSAFIISLSGYSVSAYNEERIKKGVFLAHLLSIGQLTHTHHEGNESLVFDINCHDLSDGNRFVGIKSKGRITNINWGNYNLNWLLSKHWREFMKPISPEADELSFTKIMKFGDSWFTEQKHKGSFNGEPEFLVEKLTKIKSDVFSVPIEGSGVFFHYDVRQVKNMAPYQANAYSFKDEIKTIGKRYSRVVHFYKIKANTSARMIRDNEIYNDYETTMELIKMGMVKN